MTKILYIPTGEYLKWRKAGEENVIDVEYLNTTVEKHIFNLLQLKEKDFDACSMWVTFYQRRAGNYI